jgi:hypothetical protein
LLTAGVIYVGAFLLFLLIAMDYTGRPAGRLVTLGSVVILLTVVVAVLSALDQPYGAGARARPNRVEPRGRPGHSARCEDRRLRALLDGGQHLGPSSRFAVRLATVSNSSTTSSGWVMMQPRGAESSIHSQPGQERTSRRDASSAGCGGREQYTYVRGRSFPTLPRRVKAVV